METVRLKAPGEIVIGGKFEKVLTKEGYEAAKNRIIAIDKVRMKRTPTVDECNEYKLCMEVVKDYEKYGR